MACLGGHERAQADPQHRLRRAPSSGALCAALAAPLVEPSDRTFDYLAPSVARALTFYQDRAAGVDVELVVRAIENHHALRRYTTHPGPELIEAFRRGDLVDVSRGWLRAGVDRRFLRELTTRWPYAGFHGIIVGKAFAWMLRHPLRPLPMLR